MARALLETVEVQTNDNPTHSVIWLHGLGADGNDFHPIVPQLRLPADIGVRFVFPHAPVRPITINGGAPMRGWYDITSLDFSAREEDAAGILEYHHAIAELIEHEIERGIVADHIILAGFSQGGAIALHTGLTGKHAVAGILALSTYLPVAEQALKGLASHARSTPLFMAHGEHDEVIALRFAVQSKEALEANGIEVDWHTYPMGHNVSAEEIVALSTWLTAQLN